MPMARGESFRLLLCSFLCYCFGSVTDSSSLHLRLHLRLRLRLPPLLLSSPILSFQTPGLYSASVNLLNKFTISIPTAIIFSFLLFLPSSIWSLHFSLWILWHKLFVFTSNWFWLLLSYKQNKPRLLQCWVRCIIRLFDDVEFFVYSCRTSNFVTDADLKFLMEILDEKLNENDRWEDVLDRRNDRLCYNVKCFNPKVYALIHF